MEHNRIITGLSRNRFVFEELFKDAVRVEYLWKPSEDKWCLLEILCHLYDEEREDFRGRVSHVLDTPDEPLPKIDPAGWVSSRNYIGQNYEEMLDKFINEREVSVEWLHSLKSPNWQNAFKHTEYGYLKAEMFLVNWLAHDYLHIRQITKLRYDFLKHISNEDLRYAGDW